MSPQKKPERHTSHMVVPHDDPIQLKSLQDVFDEHLVLIKATAEALKALVNDQEKLGNDQDRLEQLLLKFTKEDAAIWEKAAARMNELEDRLRNLEGKPNHGR